MSSITLKRRTHHKLKPQKPIKGFILELTIDVPEPRIAFVRDLHGKTDPQPWDTVTVMDAIKAEFERNMQEHFGAKLEFAVKS